MLIFKFYPFGYSIKHASLFICMKGVLSLLTNVMQEIVHSLVRVMMRGSEYQTFCKCGQCERDIIALSLNTLPAHYVTTEKGRIAVFERLNTAENLEWINKRIIHSIYVVGKYPHRH